MRIFLTGASGFTGRHFQTLASQAGHVVEPLTADLNDKNGLSAELHKAKPDAVVHLAAISFVGHADATAFYAVNVVGSMNLLSALSELPIAPKSVLLASSANVYGNCEISPIAEDQAPEPVNHYATSKLAMELMARTYVDRLPIVVTRPFNYTGPGQAANFLIPKLVSHFARREPIIELGNLHVEREFNDVRMVCNAYLRLLDSGIAGETYNVCTGRPYSLSEVIQELEKLTDHHMQVKVNPAFVRANEVHRLCGSPSKLEACIGEPTDISLRETLSNMLDHAQS